MRVAKKHAPISDAKKKISLRAKRLFNFTIKIRKIMSRLFSVFLNTKYLSYSIAFHHPNLAPFYRYYVVMPTEKEIRIIPGFSGLKSAGVPPVKSGDCRASLIARER